QGVAGAGESRGDGDLGRVGALAAGVGGRDPVEVLGPAGERPVGVQVRRQRGHHRRRGVADGVALEVVAGGAGDGGPAQGGLAGPGAGDEAVGGGGQGAGRRGRGGRGGG